MQLRGKELVDALIATMESHGSLIKQNLIELEDLNSKIVWCSKHSTAQSTHWFVGEIVFADFRQGAGRRALQSEQC